MGSLGSVRPTEFSLTISQRLGPLNTAREPLTSIATPGVQNPHANPSTLQRMHV